jgi:hypothetical protein
MKDGKFVDYLLLKKDTAPRNQYVNMSYIEALFHSIAFYILWPLSTNIIFHRIARNVGFSELYT